MCSSASVVPGTYLTATFFVCHISCIAFGVVDTFERLQAARSAPVASYTLGPTVLPDLAELILSQILLQCEEAVVVQLWLAFRRNPAFLLMADGCHR